MKNYIGGVILYDETIKQKTSSGKTIPELIKSFGSIPGIKVDTGAKKLAGSPEEKITEGLDGLRERLAEYYKLRSKIYKMESVYIIFLKNILLNYQLNQMRTCFSKICCFSSRSKNGSNC